MATRIATLIVLFGIIAACGDGTTTTASSPTPTGTASLAGMVRSSDGEAIAGARVSIRPNPNTLNPSVSTDGEGHYRFDNLPVGDTLVHVNAPRFDEAEARVVVNGYNRLNFVLRPLPQMTLHGLVQDADTGAPIAGATVSFLLTPGSTVNPPRSATTNEQGEYRFENVYPANANFSATAPGYQEWRTGLHLTLGTTLNFQLRRLPHAQTFTGSVGSSPSDFPFTMRRAGSADVTLTWDPKSTPTLQLQVIPISGPLTPPGTPIVSSGRIDVSYSYIWAGQYAWRVVNPSPNAPVIPFTLTTTIRD